MGEEVADVGWVGALTDGQAAAVEVEPANLTHEIWCREVDRHIAVLIRRQGARQRLERRVGQENCTWGEPLGLEQTLHHEPPFGHEQPALFEQDLVGNVSKVRHARIIGVADAGDGRRLGAWYHDVRTTERWLRWRLTTSRPSGLLRYTLASR